MLSLYRASFSENGVALGADDLERIAERLALQLRGPDVLRRLVAEEPLSLLPEGFAPLLLAEALQLVLVLGQPALVVQPVVEVGGDLGVPVREGREDEVQHRLLPVLGGPGPEVADEPLEHLDLDVRLADVRAVAGPEIGEDLLAVGAGRERTVLVPGGPALRAHSRRGRGRRGGGGAGGGRLPRPEVEEQGGEHDRARRRRADHDSRRALQSK